MYKLVTEAHFDSAHFLAGYNGKCRNIHGHRWKIVIEIYSESLQLSGQCKGMLVDFGDLKRDLKTLADSFDHALIIEKGTLKTNTINALKEEQFNIIEVDFRPTAENFAKCFYDIMKSKGYKVSKITVYETPDNCAIYEEV